MNVLRALAATNEPCVILTLAGVPPSAPRAPGAHMIVTADATRGTIGGGETERAAVLRARQMLANPGRGSGESHSTPGSPGAHLR